MSRVNSAGLGWKSLLIAVCVLIGGSTEGRGADPPEDKLKLVRAAWQERQDAVRSATIRWIERHTLTEEVQSEDPEGKSPPNVPPEPFETIGKLSFDGIKMRFSGTFRILNSAVGKFEINEVNQQGQRIPKVCTNTDFSADGVVHRTCEFRFKDVALNDVHPADEFDLKFPAGTWVTDLKKNPRGKTRQVKKDDSP